MTNKRNALELINGDDFIEYYLFPSQDFSENNDKEKLNLLISNINAYLEKYIQEYIWHRDGFHLTAKTSNTILLNNDNQTESIPPHLYGITYHAGNIEDEWFIVFLLFQLTKKFHELIIRVIDSDGEFLLIEAANYLPAWADPDTCDKRVYIYKGFVHIVAPEVDDEIELITMENAVNEIYKNSSLTIASKDIQETIFKKISYYPEKIKEDQYKATVYVPIGVASILEKSPKLISLAVQTFCNRDSMDIKACRAMKYFPPEIRVLTSVTFTKHLYAMLMHSKYQPDRKTGWNLPPLSAENYKAHSLGVKIACGFEILIPQTKSNTGRKSDKEWNIYKQKLEEKGYFKDLLENSKEHNVLLNKAKDYFLNYKDGISDVITTGQEILSLLESLDLNEEKFRKEEKNLPPDDDDSWLNISPDDLDRMLEEQYGHERTMVLNGDISATEFTENIDNFLSHVSGLEGAEFPNEDKPPIRPPRKNKSNKVKVSFSKDTKDETTSTKVNFDASSFACAVQNILNFMIPEDDSWDFDSDSDMSDYDLDENGTSGESNKMQALMDAMDKELAQTTIGESFIKKEEPDGFEDIENFKPVDIDVNALKNIIESYRSQLGEAGPSSNMLGPMGIHMKENINGSLE